MKAVINPVMNNGRSAAESSFQFSAKSTVAAPNMMGMAMIKVKSDAVLWLHPTRRPPAMVDPDREKPGHKDKH